MKNIEEAIKEAIKNGYTYCGNTGMAISHDGNIYTFGPRLIESNALLDPLFWQALGKARGWDKEDENRRKLEKKSGSYSGYQEGTLSYFGYDTLRKWHRLIDHLAQGKDAESFFAGLNH